MASLVSSVIDWLSAHSHIAYLAVFLLALSESIPMIGVIVPGTAVILALSALVPSGVLVLWPLLGRSDIRRDRRGWCLFLARPPVPPRDSWALATEQAPRTDRA